jgi:DNA-binding MarR family transcriptional regulator
MSNDPSYGNHLGHSVKRLYLLMGQYFNEVLMPYGVAQSQWYILLYIHYYTEVTQKDLQKILQVKSATLTVAINALCRKGWVTRAHSETDRRVKVLKLTPQGVELWKNLPDPIAAIRAQMLKGISTQEEQVARQILDRAIQNFELLSEQKRVA